MRTLVEVGSDQYVGRRLNDGFVGDDEDERWPEVPEPAWHGSGAQDAGSSIHYRGEGLSWRAALDARNREDEHEHP